VIRPGGLALLYLYYALDGRGPIFKAIFGVVNGMRTLTSRWPRPVVFVVAFAIALLCYWPLARISAVLEGLGRQRVAAMVPLSFYSRRSFRTMVNDSLDRFGTRVERRLTREQMDAFLRQAGLDEVRFSTRPPFWHAVGRRKLVP